MTIPRIFDRRLLKFRRNRAASHITAHDVVLNDIAARLADRLLDMDRRFERALLLGAGHGVFAKTLQDTGKIDWLAQADLSHAILCKAEGHRFVVDTESIPVSQSSMDLVLSADLHSVNDVPGTLAQIRRILKPDGLFLAVVPGVGTLGELAGALLDAEMATRGGASPRVSPFMDVRDAGALLQRAGFALPVVDVETVEVRYRDMDQLFADLRGSGEASVLHERSRLLLRRDTLATAEQTYRERHQGADGRIPATLNLLMLTAWAPHASQQQPARRGSGTINLGNALG